MEGQALTLTLTLTLPLLLPIFNLHSHLHAYASGGYLILSHVGTYLPIIMIGR